MLTPFLFINKLYSLRYYPLLQATTAQQGGGGGAPAFQRTAPGPYRPGGSGSFGGRGGGRGGGGRGRGRGRFMPAPRPTVPMNDDIRAPEVRVISEDKEPLGVFNTDDAIVMARDAGVDLIMVVPDAVPPVCRLMEYSKYNYELLKAAKDAKKKQREAIIETKEVKLRPATDVHDYQTKMRAAQKFLAKGNRVKLIVQFKGREMEFKDIGREMFSRFFEDLGGEAEVAVEQAPQMQGRQMTMILSKKE